MHRRSVFEAHRVDIAALTSEGEELGGGNSGGRYERAMVGVELHAGHGPRLNLYHGESYAKVENLLTDSSFEL